MCVVSYSQRKHFAVDIFILLVAIINMVTILTQDCQKLEPEQTITSVGKTYLKSRDTNTNKTVIN